MKFYGIECKGKFTLQKLTSLPIFDDIRDEGRLVYNESDNKIYYGTSSAWEEVTIESNAVNLDGTQYITGLKYFNNNLPRSNSDPTNDEEFARKLYVDNQISGARPTRYKVVTTGIYFTNTYTSAPPQTPSAVTNYAKDQLSGVSLEPYDLIYVSYQSRGHDRDSDNYYSGNGSGTVTIHIYIRRWERVVYQIQPDLSWRILTA